MSLAEGKQVLDAKLKMAMANSPAYQALLKNYREKLNTENIHILDISYDALVLNADTSDKLERFDESYTLFLVAIESATSGVTVYNTLEDLKNSNPGNLTKGVIYVRSSAILICPNFGSARNFITYKVSKQIPFDEFFGITNRARGKDELIREGYEVLPIINDKFVGPLKADHNDIIGYRVRGRGGKLYKHPRYFNSEGLELANKGSIELLVRELSNFDIGHLGTSTTPLSFKLTQLLKVPSISGSLKASIQNSLTELSNLTGNVGFKFHNRLPESYTAGGYLDLTLEFYTLNGKKAKVETSVYTAIRKQIIDELRVDIGYTPGSNTMYQDSTEIIKQTLVAAIKGTKAKISLPKHSPIVGTFKDSPKIKKAVVNSKSISIGSKNSRGTVKSKPTVTNTVSLANLQLLLNTHLQDVISANMGSGSSRNILNYQTGRFAASVNVERMSQSREGMITAFYNYMKAPYQTFEPGYRQGSPKTRDPKLLIAKSIREIAATKVGNRLRAVSV